MDNYDKIIEAFLNGTVEGIENYGMKPEHLETQISHIFLFPDFVYKISKRNNAFFNKHFRDLDDLKTRLFFYKADFYQNNYFSPEVYLQLYGVCAHDNKILLNNDVDNAEDAVIKMRRVNLEHNLSQLLHSRSLMEEDFRFMGHEQTKEIALYPHQPKYNLSYYNHFQARLDDLRNWMYSAPKYFSKEETDNVIQVLKNYLEKEKEYFNNFDTSKYVISLDNHSDNIFYENKKVFFLDIYPPKEEWGIASAIINIYRPATDILILMGEKYARAFIRGYKDYYGSLDEGHEIFYFVYSAAIQAISLFNLSENNDLKLKDSIVYKNFITDHLKKLSN